MHDAFISHASEDKTSFVADFARTLQNLGASVWYDDYTLKPGDSLSRSIDKGLIESRYGVVVLSPSFFAKKWAEYELRGLVSRENDGCSAILPLWHNVTKREVSDFSPPLSDKFAIKTENKSIMETALRVLDVIRPDLVESWKRRVLAVQTSNAEPLHGVKIANLTESPIRHKTLPKSLLLRIRLNQFVLRDILPMTLSETIDSFRRDTHPEKEVKVWELIAACYIAAIEEPLFSTGDRQIILAFFLHQTSGGQGIARQECSLLSEAQLTRLATIYEDLAPKAFEV